MPSSGRTVLGTLGGADAAEPVRGRTQAVAVVVEQGMLARQLRLGAVILLDPAARGEIRLQERDLAVLVQVGSRVGDRLGEILAEPGEVHLVAALGRRDDDPVRAREPVEERAARRRAVDHRRPAA